MKVVIAGGTSQAEFIISMFKGKENELIVINPSQEVADTLVKRTRVKVYKGLPWRKYVLEETNAYGADVFIALCESDTDNDGACMMAKKVFSVKYRCDSVHNVIAGASYIIGDRIFKREHTLDIKVSCACNEIKRVGVLSCELISDQMTSVV